MAVFLIGALVISQSLSYLVATKVRDNVFTIGSVRLEISEENYPSEPEDRVLPPMGIIDKDPKLKNIGSNDAYVFMKVTVPLCEVQLVDEETKKVIPGGKALREVFNLTSASENALSAAAPAEFTVTDTGIFSYDNKWILLSAEEDTEKNTHSYTFGYTSIVTKSGAGSETTTLFDKLQLRSILEGELDTDVLQKVTISAYGIQSDELPDSMAIADTDNVSETELREIFSIYEKQEGE